ncbi:MAG: hypothetical protein LBC40_00340 [Dysgonamonadaceae bacterium]|nr:hypothetical protein [Dysgonamonadaceae bacterium]
MKARLYHPVERLLGAFEYGDSLTVSIPAFRSLLLGVSSGDEYKEPGVSGLDEATVFAADNNALEVRSLLRSGETNIPQVKAARDAFFSQPAFVNRGIWDRQLFDGDLNTGFWPSRRKGDIRIKGGCFRLDLGETTYVDSIVLKVNMDFGLSGAL